MSLLEVSHIKKIYTTRMGIEQVTALKDVHFSVEDGEFVAIMGESGSGKTTLLNILASLDVPTAGKAFIDGKDFSKLKDNERAIFRRQNLGFVFQDFNLLDNFTIEDNIKLPLVLAGESHKTMDAKVKEVAKRLEIDALLSKYPYEVSGGQKQRTAVARALITNPRILLADEPTGALDSKAATNLMRLFREINKSGQTILMVTHSNVAASYASRVMFIKDGEVFHQLYRGEKTRSEMLDDICDAVTVLMRGGDESES
ncbi:ABC transporter ATP-binding protein [Butyrivibrio sp. XB500-5]|uniref:ABC transporter ATP-binding protein n=1 Tax=Butyrivibrio sp. XB500-5 TaxID=2364880 RepID=UPI000EA9DEE9|nr:ABC transporter ATP-binding protein [Butyrivibrio sp. XB500-5]RKM58563.1 ABC transporter ATP-binding protein [Butyrivibrio sp. XB500-5]